MASMNRIPGMMSQPSTPTSGVTPPGTEVAGRATAAPPGLAGMPMSSGSTLPGLPRPPTMPQGQGYTQRAVVQGTPQKPAQATGRPPGLSMAGTMMGRARGGP